MLVVNVVTEVLFDNTVHTLSLTIRFGVGSCRQVSLDPKSSYKVALERRDELGASVRNDRPRESVELPDVV